MKSHSNIENKDAYEITMTNITVIMHKLKRRKTDIERDCVIVVDRQDI